MQILQSLHISHKILEIIVKLLLFFFSISIRSIAKIFLSLLHDISFQLKNRNNKGYSRASKGDIEEKDNWEKQKSKH